MAGRSDRSTRWYEQLTPCTSKYVSCCYLQKYTDKSFLCFCTSVEFVPILDYLAPHPHFVLNSIHWMQFGSAQLSAFPPPPHTLTLIYSDQENVVLVCQHMWIIHLLALGTMCSGNNINLIHARNKVYVKDICIGGSNAVLGTHPHSLSNFFHFYAVFGKHCAK